MLGIRKQLTPKVPLKGDLVVARDKAKWSFKMLKHHCLLSSMCPYIASRSFQIAINRG